MQPNNSHGSDTQSRAENAQEAREKSSPSQGTRPTLSRRQYELLTRLESEAGLSTEELRGVNGKVFSDMPEEIQQKMRKAQLDPASLEWPEDLPMQLSFLEDRYEIVEHNALDDVLWPPELEKKPTAPEQRRK